MENSILGSRIARRRKELGLTQKQLADRLHITDRAVSRWERGVGAPDLSLIVPLAEALSLSTDELLRGTSAETQQPHTAAQARDDRPHLIPFRHMLLTWVAPLLWPVAACIILLLPAAPHWLKLAAVIGYLPALLGHNLLCLHRFFRCPRCGHILWHFSSPRAHRRVLGYPEDQCLNCGKPVFLNTVPLFRFLEFFRRDRPE